MAEFDFSPDLPSFVVECDDLHAKGSVGIQQDAYGASLYVEGFTEPVAAVDLFYLAQPEENVPNQPIVPRLIIYDKGGQVMCGVLLFPDGPKLWFERTVSVVDTHEIYGNLYGCATSEL